MSARVLLVAACFLLAACGGGNGTDTTSPATTPTTTTTTEAAEPTTGVSLIDTSLGSILADPDGWTIYGFTVDDPGTSRCYDGCAALWPPVDGDTPIGDGLDSSLFSVTPRADGTTQLVMGDWPLYLYAGDASPGDVNGQGVEGVWFVIDAGGNLVGASTAAQPDDGASPPPDPYDY